MGDESKQREEGHAVAAFGGDSPAAPPGRVGSELAAELERPGPRLRSDLDVKTSSSDLVTVRRPDSATSFPLYRLEWDIAKLLDGKRGIQEIVLELRRRGVVVESRQVQSFLRELKGYGFLHDGAEVGAAKTDERSSELSPEESQLIQMATARRCRGDTVGATNYLLAALEIRPENHEARELLRQVQTETAVALPEKQPEAADDEKRRGFPSGRVFALSIAAAVLLGGFFILATWAPWRSVDKPRADSGQTAPTQAAPAPSYTAVLELAPASTLDVLAPASGTVLDLPAAVGAFVEEGGGIANIGDPKAARRVRLAQARAAQLQEKAKAAPAYRDFAVQANLAYKAAQRAAKVTVAAAPRRALLEEYLVESGANVRQGQKLARLSDPTELTAQIPRFPPEVDPSTAECVLVNPGGGPVACRITVVPSATPTEPALRVVVENRAGALPAHAMIEVRIRNREANGQRK